MTELEQACTDRGVTSTAVPVAVPYNADAWQKQADAWSVTLAYQGRTLTVPFFTGPGLRKSPTPNRDKHSVFYNKPVPVAPSPADVLSCIVSDATSYENARSFDDYCAEFGLDTDSRRAERTYHQCAELSKQVRALLGEDFEAFASAEH